MAFSDIFGTGHSLVALLGIIILILGVLSLYLPLKDKKLQKYIHMGLAGLASLLIVIAFIIISSLYFKIVHTYFGIIGLLGIFFVVLFGIDQIRNPSKETRLKHIWIGRGIAFIIFIAAILGMIIFI